MSKIKPIVSLIFPVYEQVEMLEKALITLKEVDAGISYEVIIVDDASPSKEIKEFYKNRRDLFDKIYVQPVNNGNSTINVNIGVSMAEGKYIQYQNSDVYFIKKDWLKLIVEAFDKNTGIVGCKTIFEDQIVNHSIRTWEQNNVPSHYERGILLNDSSKGAHVCDLVSGCGMTISKRLWKRIGGFTVYQPFGWDDIDCCLAMHEFGLKVKCQCDSWFVHFGSKSYGGKETPEYHKNFDKIKKKYKNIIFELNERNKVKNSNIH